MLVKAMKAAAKSTTSQAAQYTRDNAAAAAQYAQQQYAPATQYAQQYAPAAQYAQHYAQQQYAPAAQYAQHYAQQRYAPVQYAQHHAQFAPTSSLNFAMAEHVVKALVVVLVGISLIHSWRAFPIKFSTITNPLEWWTLLDVRRYATALSFMGMSLLAMASLVLYCSAGDVSSVIWKLVPNLLPGVGTLLSIVLFATKMLSCVNVASLLGAVAVVVAYAMLT